VWDVFPRQVRYSIINKTIYILEIFEFNICEEDKFLIIASDGIWEFISSNECIGIIKDFYIKNDAETCVNHLYNISSGKWIEVR
jgi:serine/threonine protein phosphatase PrpC